MSLQETENLKISGREEETLLQTGFIKLNFHRWAAVLGKHPPGGVPSMVGLQSPVFTDVFQPE